MQITVPHQHTDGLIESLGQIMMAGNCIIALSLGEMLGSFGRGQRRPVTSFILGSTCALAQIAITVYLAGRGAGWSNGSSLPLIASNLIFPPVIIFPLAALYYFYGLYSEQKICHTVPDHLKFGAILLIALNMMPFFQYIVTLFPPNLIAKH